MTIDEARQAIKAHFNGDISNVRKFLEALKIAEESDGEMTIDQLEKWGNSEVKNEKN